MSLESIFKLSLVMNMIDNLTGPLSSVQNSVNNSVSGLQGMEQTFGSMTKYGAAMTGVGMELTGMVMAPVAATFDTRRAIGELSSLGVQDLQALEDASRRFSDTWAGTTKADFITAAYDIKSGISSLSDEGVARYTEMAGITAKATKATTAEMTSLFATGYGIYKNYYDDLDDFQFGEMFSAGISESVRAFKTSGSEMAAGIQSLGKSATNANVPMEEQLAILGMLQATMSGSEAGTKYNAFLRSAAKAGEALGLEFLDAENNLKALPEILEQLQGKYGDTIEALEKQELQKAFGDIQSVQFIDLMYDRCDDLQDNVLSLYDAMGGGIGVATEMANAINQTEPERYQALKQQMHNIAESAGSTVLPVINELMDKGVQLAGKVADWVNENQELVRIILLVGMALGGFLTVAGTVVTAVGAIGLVFTKTAGLASGFLGVVKKLPGMLDTVRLYGMYAGDGIKKGFSVLKSAGAGAISSIKTVALNMASMAKTAAVTAVNGLKNMALGMAGMAKQAITTAATAMPGLIASVWSFTAALLANPITWIVIAVIALIAGLVLLYNKCEWFRNAVDAVWGAIKTGVMAAWNVIKNVFGAIAGFFGNVFSAAKDTVVEKLGNIKAAYERHGGGIKGVAAAALEGVKSLYTAGFTFIDNLTGGKLTELGNKVGEKLAGVKAKYEEHGGGIKGVAAVAMEGIKSAHIAGFNFLDNLTGGRLSSIAGKFADKFQGIRNTASNVMNALKDTVSQKLGNMRDAYERHGGIKGVAAAAVEGVKGYYTAGFTFLDNLTGGKLTAIKDKFTDNLNSVRDTVASGLEASKQYAASKLTEMQSTFQEHGGGIRGAAAAAITGVRSVFADGYNFLDTLTGGRLSAIREKFTSAVDGMRNAITEKFAAFKESGRKLIETFTEGIRSALSAPVEAVKGGLAKVRELLPFSDAKTGPLSTLTLSGTRTMSTLAEGITQADSLPAQAAAAGMEQVAGVFGIPGGGLEEERATVGSTREDAGRISLREIIREVITEKTEKETTTERESGINIERLLMNVDITKIKELSHLFKLLRELEDYANANGLAADGEV